MFISEHRKRGLIGGSVIGGSSSRERFSCLSRESLLSLLDLLNHITPNTAGAMRRSDIRLSSTRDK